MGSELLGLAVLHDFDFVGGEAVEGVNLLVYHALRDRFMCLGFHLFLCASDRWSSTEGLLRLLIELFQQPLQLCPCVRHNGAVGEKARPFPGVFMLQFGIHLAADYKEFQGEPQFP